VNIGNAQIQGLGADLNLVGDRFNWVTSVFYITYMVVEIPSNILLRLIGPRLYLPILIIGFGLVSLGTAFVRTFKDLLLARALLGIFEGGFMP
jgi:MFS family permease